MNNSKNIILDTFCKNLQENHPELPESVRWKIANELARIALETMIAHNKGIYDTYHNMALEYEQHRKKFKDHIDFIDKSSKTLIFNMKQGTFVTMQNDKKTGKPKLVGRTKVVDDMVDFLNKLDEEVFSFYKEVFKIEETDSNKPQMTLFS